MSKNLSLISIIIPTFNRAHLIGQTLISFVNQSYKKWEIIVIDDGSKDDTISLINSFQDTRIKYQQRNDYHKKGPSGCRNQGLSMASGSYILFFDDDDIAHPDLLKLCLYEFQEKNIDFCRYLRNVFQGEFNGDFDRSPIVKVKEFTGIDVEKMITNKLPFNTCAVIWKSSCFTNEKFNEDLFYADEWECYSRVLLSGASGISLNKVLLYARKHPFSSTGNFLSSNPKYLNSTRKAMKLVIQNLDACGKLTPSLFKYFIRSGFMLKDETIIKVVLEKYEAGFFTKLKYNFGFKFYPILRPLFIVKSKLIKN